mmetsp:Transcript_2915/g.3052  ORF Transcript_2915/g.3052 Transcript_2915/m.3052 type:complete len:134 (-) Transcript_2915:242-643(-)|eukprot:CAMPEP_0119039088 /NCGR_PEP_ID=MMETSP1177-20130426/8393_1 /TAXON_ID=2985 /ORGANISM="Ochromonas sp, Strain CCMP1899" /LENGTH=133 /DNA_ID=CAMNT_0007002525 /DNA_START=59 /DNA_END=457 /DNA_ORIENTATION=+
MFSRMFKSTAFRSAKNFTQKVTQKRTFSGHAAYDPPLTGFEGWIRGIFPKDEHFAIFVLGFWASLYPIYKVTIGAKHMIFGKPVPVVKAAVVVQAPTGETTNEIPTAEKADELMAFLTTDGNFDKFIGSMEKW